MVMIRIDIDDDALATAARALGTSTRTETVNAALRQVCAYGPGPARAEGMRAMVVDGRIGFSAPGRPDDVPDPDAPPATRSAP